jgi:hypothetical protein
LQASDSAAVSDSEGASDSEGVASEGAAEAESRQNDIMSNSDDDDNMHAGLGSDSDQSVPRQAKKQKTADRSNTQQARTRNQTNANVPNDNPGKRERVPWEKKTDTEKVDANYLRLGGVLGENKYNWKIYDLAKRLADTGVQVDESGNYTETSRRRRRIASAKSAHAVVSRRLGNKIARRKSR